MEDVHDGPYLGVAVFCEKAKFDPDGSPSLGRVIDLLYLTPTKDGSPATAEVQIFFLFRAGSQAGKSMASVRVTTPDGERLAPMEFGFEFPVPYGNATNSGPFQVKAKENGRMLMDVFLDGRFVTRMILNLVMGHPPLNKMKMGRDARLN